MSWSTMVAVMETVLLAREATSSELKAGGQATADQSSMNEFGCIFKASNCAFDKDGDPSIATEIASRSGRTRANRNEIPITRMAGGKTIWAVTLGGRHNPEAIGPFGAAVQLSQMMPSEETLESRSG